MTEADIAVAAAKIAKDYPLSERLIRRLIRIQVQKTQPAALYDLDYDLQLNAAIKAVQNIDFTTMLKNTKTLRQLQEEAEDAKTAEGKGLTASLK
jgi:carboxyl-terminal processing protease